MAASSKGTRATVQSTRRRGDESVGWAIPRPDPNWMPAEGTYTTTLIYSGVFSNVYLYESEKYQLAAKYVTSRRNRFDELQILKDLPQHPNIVPFLGMHKGHFLFEYYPINLLEFLQTNPIDEKVAAKIFHQVSHAILALHAVGIAHLDIKPENILVDDDSFRVAVSDFGLSKFFDGEGLHQGEVGGSLEYISPDAIRGKPFLLPKLDTWALGVAIYCSLLRQHPYEVDRTQIQWNLIYRAELLKKMERRSYRQGVGTPALKDLLFGLLDPNPLTRFGIDEAVGHEWFSRRPPSPRHTL